MNTVLVAIGMALALVPYIALFVFLVRMEGWKSALGCAVSVIVVVAWLMVASYLVQTGLGER